MTPKNKDVVVSALRCLYADNFVTYYKSHAFHFNVQGQTFSQDHRLLNKLYDYLLESHDTLGEQLRQLDKPVPTSLKAILSISEIEETKEVVDSQGKEIEDILTDIEVLLRNGQWVYEEAGRQSLGGLETCIGDYLRDLSKFNWMLKATIKRSL